ncbi:MAG: arginase [Bacilli bacterium]|nr:arginase [Bacilli bacterium]
MKIVKACSDLGVHVNGSNLAPNALLKNKGISSIEVDKEDIEKELEKENKLKNLKYVNSFNEKLYNEILKIDEKVLTIGGDHSIAIASCLASKKKNKNIGIVWIDSHADFHTTETTISGNIHGMPFATVCGINKDTLSYFFDGEYFKGENAILVGGRDIEDAEFDNLSYANVKLYTTNDIKKKGAKEIIKKALDEALEKTDGLHVSFDIDVIDPLIAPGVSVKAKDGLTFEEAKDIADILIEYKDKIKSVDLVEFNPSEDKDNVTLKITEEILNKLLEI